MFERPSKDDKSEMIQVLTTTQIAHNIAKDNERMNINNSVIATLGRTLTKHGFERVSFTQENTSYRVYGWKVKPSVMGIVRNIKGASSENDLF